MAKGKKLIWLVPVLALLCQGCASQGEYYRETPHTVASGESRFQTNISIKNYYGLQNTLLRMIGSSRKSNTVPISNDYEGSLEEDLERVAREIPNENPLGSFAVSSISMNQTRVLTYQELRISVQYKRTPKEISSIQECPSLRNFESRLSELLFSYGDQGFYSTTGLEDEEQDIYDRVMRCWYSAPDTAYGLRELTILTYPESGPKRIVEVQLQWTEDRETLQTQGEEARQAARQICQQFEGETLEEKLAFVEQYLTASVEADEEAMRVVAETGGRQARTPPYTAYGALVQSRAAQAGMAHGAKLLLDELGVNSSLILGDRQGASCLWLRVQNQGQSYHYDPTSTHGLMNSQQAQENGYEYNHSVYQFE